MKAKVKNIKYSTHVHNSEHSDSFVMTDMIGEIIEVEPREDCKKWFRDEHGYNYHKNWLTFVNL